MAARSNSQPQQAQMSPQQQNQIARQLILRGGTLGNTYFPPSIDMWQPLHVNLSNGVTQGSVLNFYVRNVGLVKRLIVRFTATVTAGAQNLTLTPLGLQNLVSNVSFFDLGQNQRINTTGWHLTTIASAKRRGVFCAAYVSDTPNGYGNNNNRVMYAPQTINANTSSEIDFQMEIPFVKNDTDLRGAIYADVTQATMHVNITLNPQALVVNGADPTLAMYQSTGADPGTLTGVSIAVFQNYLDQLPRLASGAPILPNIDIGTAYMLNNTASGLPVVNQDNAAAFTNARTYESVAWIYDNNGTLNANFSDLTYVQLQSANFTNIMNIDGKMLGLMDRNVIADDFPLGMGYLDFRHRPIDTNQYGNMQLILKPSSVTGGGAVFLYGWEAYGIIGLVNQGGSLPMGG